MEFEISGYGAFLATRDKAAKIREELERKIRQLKPSEVVEISFSGVEAVTVSFADELIGRLFTSHAAGDLPEVALILTDLNDEVREALHICLERRDEIAVMRKGRRHELIGSVDDHLRSTYEKARARKEFRATELADDLGITPQNANNRLKSLIGAGALVRTRTSPEGGGKEFVYRTPR